MLKARIVLNSSQKEFYKDLDVKNWVEDYIVKYNNSNFSIENQLEEEIYELIQEFIIGDLDINNIGINNYSIG